MARVTLEEVLARLPEPKRRLRDGSWMVRCPLHPDENPSLHVTEHDGRLLMYCFGCGATTREVLEHLGLDGKKCDPIAIYNYRDEEGNLLYQKLRFPPKDFRFRRVIPSGGFEWGIKGVRRVLYNLPEVLKAERVFVVEGEKDADRLISAGLCATTNDDGAGKWKEEYSKALKGKEVIIVPDNDPPGKEHAQLVALSVSKYARKIRIVELPDLPKGGDVSDFLAKHSLEEFLGIVERTPEWSPAPIKEASVQVHPPNAYARFPEVGVEITCKRLRLHSDGRLTAVLRARVGAYELPYSGLVNLSAPQTRRQLAKSMSEEIPLPWEGILEVLYQKLMEKLVEGEPARVIKPSKTKDKKFLVEDFLPEGLDTLLWGPGGTGKSWIALALALSLHTGEPFLGKRVMRKGPTLYLDWETSPEEMARRLSFMTEEEFLYYKRMNVPLVDALDNIHDLVEEIDPVLVIMDSFARAVGGNIIDESVVANFFATVRTLGTTTLIIHHPPKQGEGPYGSAYITWLPRCVWELKSHGQDETGIIRGVLVNTKINIAAKKPPIPFELSLEPWELRQTSLEEVEEKGIKERIIDFIEHYREGKGMATVREIAENLQLSPDTVRRALKELEELDRVAQNGEGKWYVVAVPF